MLIRIYNTERDMVAACARELGLEDVPYCLMKPQTKRDLHELMDERRQSAIIKET